MAGKKRLADKLQLCVKIKPENLTWLRNNPENMGAIIDAFIDPERQKEITPK